ncbi:MAG: cobalamin-dependent protein [Deltaproteobacteria bacterium]|nr:cobalamin-dependent protein [Deltaproteobacteria bacterium]
MTRPLRLLLVRPAGRFASLVYPDGPWVGVPLGLLYLAAAARRAAGVEVQILDALAEPDYAALRRAKGPVRFGLDAESVAARAAAFAPDVVGVGVAAEVFFDEAVEAISALRRALPGAVVLAGGSDVSMHAERYLAAAPGLDAAVVGEGERALEAVLAAVGRGDAFTSAPGLVVRRPDGELARNAPELVPRLDDYVLDWADVELERYFELKRRGFPSRISVEYPGSDRAIYLATSRGCPYPCTFCSVPVTMGKAFRAHSPEYVLEQLTTLSRHHGVRHVHLEDDNLALDRPRLRRLLEELVEADLGLTWDTPNGVRADRFDAELVDLCSRSGCVYLMFGVESGSQTVLDTIVRKELDLADLDRTLTACSAAGIDHNALFIFGLPGETWATVRQTYRFAFERFRRHGTVPFFSIFKPYAGTPLHAQSEQQGLLVDTAALHAEGKIPHLLLAPTMAETPELPLRELARFYRRYMLRFVAHVFWNAMRVMWRHPLLILLLNLRLWGRVLRAPWRLMPTLRSFFWGVLLFPRAQVRLRARGPRRLGASARANALERPGPGRPGHWPSDHALPISGEGGSTAATNFTRHAD